MVVDPRNPALEAAIAADPYDREAYRVYADWLEEQGDIRARLIRLQLANETGKPFRKLLAENEGYLFGPLARMRKQLVWQNGFIYSAMFYPNTRFHDDIATLFAHPSARFLVEISVSDSSENGLDPIAKAPPSLRRFSVYDTGPMLRSLASIAHLFPQLHHLALVGGARLFEQMPLPNLRTLQLDVSAATRMDLTFPSVVSANVRGAQIGRIELPAVEMVELQLEGAERAIAEARWPALQRLGLRSPVDVAALAPLFPRDDMPQLKRLSIAGASDPEQLVRLLRDAPFAKQLVYLELSNGALDDAAARLITRAAFPALEELDASSNPLSDAGYAALDALDIPDLVDDRRYNEMGE